MTSLQKWGKSVRTTIPVMAGYLVLGAGFGILLRTRGFGLGWALAMSLFIYAGSMQYVAVDLLTGGASLLTAAVTTLLVNARHLFYGISMLERYRAAGKYAPYLIFSLTDETYSLVAAREELTGAECFRISLLDQFYWVLGTALGSLAGAYLNVNTTGIDFSLTAHYLPEKTGHTISTYISKVMFAAALAVKIAAMRALSAIAKSPADPLMRENALSSLALMAQDASSVVVFHTLRGLVDAQAPDIDSLLSSAQKAHPDVYRRIVRLRVR